MAVEQNILYSWNFQDKKDRSPLWYMVALSCVIGLAIWGFLTQQYGMSIIVLLIAGFFYFLENNSEEYIQVIISDLGISVQNNFYDYAQIGGFSLVYDGNQAVYLRLQMKRRGISFMNIGINTSIASQVRPVLAGYIEENAKQDMTFLEKITHLLKL